MIYPPHLDPVSLRRSVSRKGSILLRELVATLLAVEYFIQYLDKSTSSVLKIFSDSQPPVGILTLNWKDTGYRGVIKDIRGIITAIQEQGAIVEISWTPGHASIAGNDFTDNLAKEAATEAALQPEDKHVHGTRG